MTIAIHPRIEKARPRRRGSFPRLPLYSAFALVAFAFVTIIFSQLTGIGSMLTDPGRPVDMVDLTIRQGDGDRVEVSDANSGKILADFAPGEGGFVRGSMRALARMRMTADVDVNEPYRVIKWSSGAVSLSDTRTGQRIYLNAFGPDQVAAFEKFLGSNGRVEP
jgi:putative photosynthetic complex assembly protein